MRFHIVVGTLAVAVFGVATADKLPLVSRGLARQVEDDTLYGAPPPPYEPSGWQPSGPQLQLPNREYGAPPPQPQTPEPTDVEVSEETILFAGQSVSTETVESTKTTPSEVDSQRQYLPPTSPDEVCPAGLWLLLVAVSSISLGLLDIGMPCT